MASPTTGALVANPNASTEIVDDFAWVLDQPRFLIVNYGNQPFVTGLATT
jgi:hypothetical protein